MKTTRVTRVLCAALVVGVSGGLVLHGQENIQEPRVFVPEPSRSIAEGQWFHVTPEPGQAPVITVDGIGADADQIQFDRTSGVLEAEGSVTLTVPILSSDGHAGPGVAVYRYSPGQNATRTVRADSVTIHREERLIEAVGNVQVSLSGDGSNILEAPEIALRYQGALTNVVTVR